MSEYFTYTIPLPFDQKVLAFLRKYILLAYDECLKQNKIRNNTDSAFRDIAAGSNVAFLISYEYPKSHISRVGDAIVAINCEENAITIKNVYDKDIGTYKGKLSYPIWIILLGNHLYNIASTKFTIVNAIVSGDIRFYLLAQRKISDKYITYSHGAITEYTNNIVHNITTLQVLYRYKCRYKRAHKKMYHYVLEELKCKPNIGIEYFKVQKEFDEAKLLI